MSRLTAASDSGGWSRNFGYDTYGNMWVTGATGVPLAGNTPTSNVYNPANNQVSGGSYDNAGNQTVVNDDTIAYDANNHVTSALDNVTHNTETYLYDGAGQRIMKIGPAGNTTYVYDAFGQLAAEYSTVPQDPQCQTCYLSYDQRGDVRLVTDQSGNVVARHDYLPFGTEVPANIAGRNSQWGSTTDVEQKFTGQIRDNETGMDYFHARYYGSAFGRFTSPDPANAGADPTNPQTWDGYAYVANNPLNAVDPTGTAVINFNPMPNPQNFGTGSGFGGSDGGMNTFNASGVGPVNGGIPYQIGDQTDSEYEPSLTPTQGQYCGGTLNLSLCSTSASTPTNLPPPVNSGPPPADPGPPSGPPSNPGKATSSSSPMQNPTAPTSANPVTKAAQSTLQDPWVLTAILPIVGAPWLDLGIGPAFDLEWNPKTSTLYVGIGIGLSAGHNFAVGPLTSGKMFNGGSFPQGADGILSGWSASGGYSFPFGLGVQGMINGSGAAAGPTIGAPGFSLASTYSVGVHF